MNKWLINIVCLVLGASVYAQDTLSLKIKEPDFPFEPMYVDADYTLKDLSQEKYSYATKRGLASATISYEMNGAKSNFRLKRNPTLRFVVKQGLVNGSVTNVKDMYRLYNVKVKKENRYHMCLSANMNGGETNQNDLPIKFKKLKEDLYLIEINNLSSGEYVIEVILKERKLYSFGVD